MDTVEVSPESGSILMNRIDKNICYLQINTLKIYYIYMYSENVYFFARVILRVIAFNSIVNKYA